MKRKKSIYKTITKLYLNYLQSDLFNLKTFLYILFILSFLMLLMGMVINTNYFIGAAALCAASAIVYSGYIFQSNQKYERSHFYLKESLELLSCTSEISQSDNNNIKWHKVISKLKAIYSLSKGITEVPHIEIFMIHYIDSAYHLKLILESINSYKFFYGVDDYIDMSDEQLYHQSQGDLTRNKQLRISKESLKYLQYFISKAAAANYDHEDHSVSLFDCWQKDYFTKPYSPNQSHNEFAKTPIIDKYIESLDKQENK